MEKFIEKVLISEKQEVKQEIKQFNERKKDGAEEILNLIIDCINDDQRFLKIVIKIFINLSKTSILYLEKSKFTSSTQFKIFIDVLKYQLNFEVVERDRNYTFVSQKNTLIFILKELIEQIQKQKKVKLDKVKEGGKPNKIIKKLFPKYKKQSQKKKEYFDKLEIGSKISQRIKTYDQILQELQIKNRKIYGKQSFEITNKYLKTKKLRQLKWSDFLYDIALEHSKNMALQKVPFGHQGFKQRAKKMQTKFNTARENVAMYSASQHTSVPQAVVQGWIKSPGHHANIIAKNYYSAVAAYYSEHNRCYYLTQLFAN